MVMVMNAIAGPVGECFVKTRHQSTAMLPEFVQDLRQSREVVAAWETALMLLKLWLRPVQIINRNADHPAADLTAQPALAAPWWSAHAKQLGALCSALATPLLQWIQCISSHHFAIHG